MLKNMNVFLSQNRFVQIMRVSGCWEIDGDMPQIACIESDLSKERRDIRYF